MTTEQMDAVDASRSTRAAAPAVPDAGTELALRPDQNAFDDKQLYALQSLGVEDAPNEAIALFFHTAKRSGLDPFARQIYMIQRAGKWGIQTAIDGFRTMRDRPGVDGQPRGYSGQKEQWCGEDGVWRDVWLSKQPPAAARVLLYRTGFVEAIPGIALWDEFAPYKNNKPMALWAKMPALMLAKCAEALALRKAFPQDFSGLYVAEEMAQAEEGVTTLRATPSAGGPSEPPAAPASSPSSPSAGPAAATAGPSSPPAAPDADTIARARQAVLSVTWKGSQQLQDDGLRAMYRRVRAAGLLKVQFAPGQGSFEEVMRRLASELPAERPADEVVEAEVVEEPQPPAPTGWAPDEGWSVPPEDQPL